MSPRRLFAIVTFLALAAGARAQTQCHFYLANHSDGNSGILLVLESAADASGKCALSGVNLRLDVGDGTAMHHVDGSFAWQTGVAYDANAASVGKVVTNGNNVNVEYASVPNAATAPVVASGAVVNGASFAAGAPVSPGSIASVFGSGFGSSPDGVTVLMGGVAAPLLAVSPQQINFQAPWQVSGQTQTALTVTSGDLTSAPIMVPVANAAPGIFLLNSSGQAAVLVANTASIAAPVGTFPGSRPAKQGEYISIYCTGLGPVTNQPATGGPASSDPVSMTTLTPVSVAIGGVSAPISFSGLAPGFLGLYQVNVQVPANAPIGSSVSLSISIGTKTSNQASIAVADGVGR